MTQQQDNAEFGLIGNRRFRIDRDRGVATRELAPGDRRATNNSVTVPHPRKSMRKQGWRIEYIFLTLAPFVCGVLYLLSQIRF